MKKLLSELFNHERYQTITVILVCVILAVVYGCQSKGQSILDPGRKVTARQLQAELDLITAQAEDSFMTIHQQDEFKQFLFEQAIIVGRTGTINPFALLTSLGTLIGTGAVIDNVRKRKEIKKLSP